jgi:type II secretory pathway component PulF
MSVSQEELRNWSCALCEAFAPGRSFVNCLDLANQQVQNEDFRRVLIAVRDRIAQGYSLSGAMAEHPDVFNEKYRTIVRYGEIYGELDVTLRRFADRPEDMEPK